MTRSIDRLSFLSATQQGFLKKTLEVVGSGGIHYFAGYWLLWVTWLEAGVSLRVTGVSAA